MLKRIFIILMITASISVCQETALIRNSGITTVIQDTLTITIRDTVRIDSTVYIMASDTLAPNVFAYGALNVTDSTATIRGIVIPNNAAATVRFLYGTALNALNDSITLAGTYDDIAVFSTPLTGLIGGTEYFFRISGTNSAGYTASDPDSFVTTEQVDITPPGIPTNLQITNEDNNSVQLSYTPPSDVDFSHIELYVGLDDNYSLYDSIYKPNTSYLFTNLSNEHEDSLGNPSASTLQAGSITNTSALIGAWVHPADSAAYVVKYWKADSLSVVDSTASFQIVSIHPIKQVHQFKIKAVDVNNNKSGFSDFVYTAPIDSKFVSHTLSGLDSATTYKVALPLTMNGAYFPSASDTVTVTTTGTTPTVECPANLISLWSLEETSGTDFADATGTADGVGSEAITSTTGQVGNALSFNGTSERISITDPDSMFSFKTNNFSIELWIKHNGNPGAVKYLISKDGGASNRWRIGINTDGTVRTAGNQGSSWAFNTTATVTNNAWHHVVLTRGYHTSNDTIKVYVDGTLSGSASIIENSFAVNAAPVYIGYDDVANTYSSGSLDQVAIYNVRLHANEVTAKYNLGIAGDPVCDSGGGGGLPPSADATPNYYVDFNSGNDSNSGLDSTSAWKTLTKVMNQTLDGRDTVFLKKGSIWNGQGITFANGGTHDTNRVVFTSYGSGNKPVISQVITLPNWNVSGNWTLHSATYNVWKFTLPANTYYINGLWLNDVYRKAAHNILPSANYPFNPTSLVRSDATTYPGIDSEYRWKSSGGILYVYATSNPASFYSNIETSIVTGSTSDNYHHLITASGINYITLDGIEFRASRHQIDMRNCDYWEIKNCDFKYVTKQSLFIARSGTNFSNYNNIHDNTFDCNFDEFPDGTYEYYSGSSGFSTWLTTFCPIWITDGASYNKVYNNSIYGYGVAGVFILGGDYDCNYNKVYDNLFDGSKYGGRAWNVGTADAATAATRGNVFVNNIMTNSRLDNHIGGDSTVIAFNIYDNVLNTTPQLYLGWGQGSEKWGAVSAFIVNNTFDSTAYYALYGFGGWSNSKIQNNLFVNCGYNPLSSTYNNLAMRDQAQSTNTNQTIQNNIFYNGGSGNIVNYDAVAMTVSTFNSADAFGDVISGNIQHTGLKSALVNSDLSYPGGSPVLSAGVSLPAYVKTKLLEIYPSGFYRIDGTQILQSNGTQLNTDIGAGGTQ